MVMIFRHQIAEVEECISYLSRTCGRLAWLATISRSCWDLHSLELTRTFLRNNILKFLSYSKHSGDTKF